MNSLYTREVCSTRTRVHNPTTLHTPNPWRERIRERMKSWGGQYTASQTDRLDPKMEALLEFEAERLAASGQEVAPW